MAKTNKKFMVLSALGIIMVVDAHCWGALNLFSFFIPYNSFFMPMFVFISGYFNKIDMNTNMWIYLKRKIKTLLLPYFGISLAALIIEWLINCYKLNTAPAFSITYILKSFKNVYYSGEITGIAASLWFVPMLFSVQIVYAFLKKALYRQWNSKEILVFFYTLHFYVVWYAKKYSVEPSKFLLFKILFFLPFIELGIIYRDELEARLQKVNHLLLLLILLIINTIRIMIMPSESDIAFNNLSTLSGFTSPYYVTPFISSVIGILFWVEIVDLIGPLFYESRIINYISENTFSIMGFHIVFSNFLNCILYAINKIIPITEFDITKFQRSSMYRWEYFPQFRLAYFLVGLFGSLALKQIYDCLFKKDISKHTKL